MSKRMFGVGRVTEEFVEVRVAPEGPPLQIPRCLYGTPWEGHVMANGAIVPASLWGGVNRYGDRVVMDDDLLTWED